MNEIGQIIATFRRNKRITQLQLAKRINKSQSWVSHVECGGMIPDIYDIKKISKIIGMDELLKQQLNGVRNDT